MIIHSWHTLKMLGNGVLPKAVYVNRIKTNKKMIHCNVLGIYEEKHEAGL